MRDRVDPRIGVDVNLDAHGNRTVRRPELAEDTAPLFGGGDHTRGRTIREAVMLALESTDPRRGALHDNKQLELVAVRNHVLAWVHSYAEHRGVLLEDSDVIGELDELLEQLRGKP